MIKHALVFSLACGLGNMLYQGVSANMDLLQAGERTYFQFIALVSFALMFHGRWKRH